MATSNVVSSTVSGSAAMTTSGDLSASSGVNTAMMGAIASGVGVSGVNARSGDLGRFRWVGFTFIGSTGSGAVMNSGVSVAPGAGAVASSPSAWVPPMYATSVWPVVPSLGSAAFASAMPGSGGFAAAPMMAPQFSGGAFGMKLDNKPPVMHGSFDLYAVELETFPKRMNVWSVIEDPVGVRSSTNDAQFALMDNIARGAILHGVPTADAELICHETNAHAMWTRFVNKRTKREYANYIFDRQHLYANKYTHERNMNDWLCEMQFQRNELLHYKKVISDEEFAEIILSNVLQTHREVVRQFSKHYDPGYQHSAPSSAQVMNALRAESELDARSDEPQQGLSISSAQAGKKQGKPQSQQQGQQEKTKKVVGDTKSKVIRIRILVTPLENKVARRMERKTVVNAGIVTRPVIFRGIVRAQNAMTMSRSRNFRSVNAGRIRRNLEVIVTIRDTLT
ncbi:hypothetical protein PC121_g6792 [Phytophthora cactorum]|nr:hypothetical protein PC121_g6792 [Phytophthora cactorum]